MSSIENGFRTALASFSSHLTPEQKQDFQFTTLDDVHKAVLTIQAQQAKRNEMMNMPRIQSFLEAMDSFGKVVEVFLNSSEFLPFIWGPIKLLLQVGTPVSGGDNSVLFRNQYVSALVNCRGASLTCKDRSLVGRVF